MRDHLGTWRCQWRLAVSRHAPQPRVRALRPVVLGLPLGGGSPVLLEVLLEGGDQAQVTGWEERTCEHCAAVFRLRGKEAAEGRGRFCSRSCWKAGIARRSRTCAQCGAAFFPKSPKTAEGSAVGMFCSKTCSGLAHRSRVARRCRHCGGTFEMKASRRASNRGRYCSKQCYTAASSRPRTCQGCGTAFRVPRSVVERGWGSFCSTSCRSRRVERACAQCGAAFTAKQSVVEDGRGRYCSDVCRHLGHRNRLERICPECGITFTVVASQAGTRRTCSRACWSRQLAQDPHMSAVLARARHAMLTQRRTTRPERILYDLLDRLVPELAPGLTWQRQMRLLDRWTVDAAIPALRLVLQADGDYWHGLHENARRNPVVVRNMANDVRQERVLSAAGWHIVRLWESDLVKRPDACVVRIAAAIRTAQRTPRPNAPAASPADRPSPA